MLNQGTFCPPPRLSSRGIVDFSAPVLRPRRFVVAQVGWRSLPQLTDSRAGSEAHVGTNPLRTHLARFCPIVRLYSSAPPRSLQLPSTRALAKRLELRYLPRSLDFPCNKRRLKYDQGAGVNAQPIDRLSVSLPRATLREPATNRDQSEIGL